MKRIHNRPKMLWVFALLIAFLGNAYGQSRQRIELETENGNCHVVPIRENGLIFLSEPAKGRLLFKKYDANLEPVWNVDCQVNPTLDVVQHSYDGRYVYLLLANPRSSVYQVVRLGTEAGIAEKIELASLNRLDISEFKANGNDAYIAGKVKNEPVLLHLDLVSRQVRIMPSGAKGSAEIQMVELDQNTGMVNATILVKQKKDYSVLVKSFAPEGITARSILIEPDKDYSLLTGRLVTLTDSTQMVIGTYGIRASQYTQGLYMTKLEDGVPVSTRYYSFTDFRNFFKFLSAREQQRMEKKIKDKKKRGDDLKLQYRLLVHDVIQKDGQYILVAEAYYPQFRYRNYNGFYPGFGGFGPFGYGYPYGGFSPWGFGYPFGGGFGGYPYGNNGQVFDGYVYTHAVVAGFDQQGNLQWDNSFEFSDIKTYTLKEKVKVKANDDHITLLYSNNGFIKSKVIRGGEVVEGVTNTPISTEREGDKVKKSYTDDLEYWYGNYFAAWGFQKIRNSTDQEVKGNRSVFYVNKVAF